MRHTEKHTETKTYTRVKSIQCDICKKYFDGAYVWDGNNTNKWPSKFREFNDVTTGIFLKKGDTWPEGATYTVYSYDICPDCFKEKLIPLLEEKFGTTPNTQEGDW